MHNCDYALIKFQIFVYLTSAINRVFTYRFFLVHGISCLDISDRTHGNIAYIAHLLAFSVVFKDIFILDFTMFFQSFAKPIFKYPI